MPRPSAASIAVSGLELPRQSEWDDVANLFRSLGSPLRVGIVVALSERSHTVGELVEVLGVSQPLVSQHLRILRASGQIRGTRHGREVTYSLVDGRTPTLVVTATRQARERGKLRPVS